MTPEKMKIIYCAIVAICILIFLVVERNDKKKGKNG